MSGQGVDAAEIARAVVVLRRGGLVAFPTETVYGLGADAANAEAVAAVFRAKRRPPRRALTVHLGPTGTPAAWGRWDERAQALARAFWPGPLTVIVPCLPTVPEIVTGGGDTVGIRVPDHPVAMALLDEFGGGVAAPSANRSGSMSPTTAAHVRADLGGAVDLVLDGGACPVGVESTVLSIASDTPQILRVGAVTAAQIEAVLGVAVAMGAPADGGRRYAPTTPLEVLPADQIAAALIGRTGSIAVLSPQPVQAPAGVDVHWVEAPAEAEDYARRLYEILRTLDTGGHTAILVADVPRGGLWEAVRSRLNGSG